MRTSSLVLYCSLMSSVIIADEMNSSPEIAPLSSLAFADEMKPSPEKKARACPFFPIAGDASFALDYFRGLPDGSFNGNFGGYASLNLDFGIPYAGLGAQLGGSYGVYDWDGKSSSPSNSDAVQQQEFATVGFYRKVCNDGVNFGIVYEWMFNQKFGVFSVDPNVSQVRSQIGYLIKGGNEVGIWGTVNTNTSHKESQEIPLKFRAICQVNLFWSHYFKNRGFTMLWAGTPYRRGLMFTDGRAGRYIAGASFRPPLTPRLSIDGHGVYMGARTFNGNKSNNYDADVSFAITYSFGGPRPAQKSYMSIGDNSNFLVDTNLNK